MSKAYLAPRLFDGRRILENHALLVEAGRVKAICAPADSPADAARLDLPGILVPSYVDLQVNGGGGVMINDDPSVETLRHVAEAHARLGAASILPTLITDTPQKTKAAIEAACEAIKQGVLGVAGLHLEGPHLGIAKKGAHEAALIRPMEAGDLEMLCDAAARLPALMLTVAPESVSMAQIRALSQAGAVVSLGHSNADYETCLEAIKAGASCATHLFNAMSQMGSRAPGLAGAAIMSGVHAGLIADGVHVHPATIGMALRAKAGPGEIFLISDAMATAGSDIDHFHIGARRIERANGRLTLPDGALAGADLDLTSAVRLLVEKCGENLHSALARATSIPAHLMGLGAGTLAPGARADFIHLDDALTLQGVWRGGSAL